MTAPLPPSVGRDVAAVVIAIVSIGVLVATALAGNPVTF